MNLIRANCRDQLSIEDVEFIVEALGNANDRNVLSELLTDADTRDLILDQDKLRDAILDNPQFLHITPHLYFYVLVRQTMRRAGIDDRELADYVSEVLADFSNADTQRRSLPDNMRDSSYLFEMIAALSEADDQTAFQIRAHIGNRSLFMTGIFADNLRERTRRRGAPDISYYEHMGATNFRAASNHRLADEFEVSHVYETLSERFHETRMALNELRERYLSVGDVEPPASLLLN
jgi:hypothetical protein